MCVFVYNDIYICIGYVYKCLWVSRLCCIVSCPSAYVCVCLSCWRFMLWKRHLHSSAMSVTYSENVAPVSGDAPSENSVEITPKGRFSKTPSPLLFLSLWFLSLLSFTHGTLTSRVWECLFAPLWFPTNYHFVTTTVQVNHLTYCTNYSEHTHLIAQKVHTQTNTTVVHILTHTCVSTNACFGLWMTGFSWVNAHLYGEVWCEGIVYEKKQRRPICVGINCLLCFQNKADCRCFTLWL